MSIDTAFIAATLAGLFGAVVVAAIGVRCTPNRWLGGAGGALFGLALGVITHVLWGWYARGFDPLQIWLLPVAAVMLLLVMSAQNWFVFYEDRVDAFQSAKPGIVVLAAAMVSVFAAVITGRHSPYFPTLWACTGSWAIILCLQPVQRSIEVNRSILVGGLVGLCKVVLPLTGIVVFIPMGIANRVPREATPQAANTDAQPGFYTNVLGLFWEVMLLLAMTLTNGARVPPQPATSDPLEYLWQPKEGQSVTDEMPRLRRDLAVLVLVLALHVLCGVVIVKA